MAYLIAIEGIDGSGKGTQANLLASRLEELFITTSVMSFPRYGDTMAGQLIGAYLNGKFGSHLDPHLAALLYAVDRFEARGELRSNLETADVVILDRFVESNIAHQSVRLSHEHQIPEFVDWIYDLEYEVFGTPCPSATILIDIPVDVSEERVLQKTGRSYTDKPADLHEGDSPYLQNVRDRYRRQAVEHEWIVVCALHPDKKPKTREEVSDEILRAVLGAMSQSWRLDKSWNLDRESLAKAIHKSWCQHTWEQSSQADRDDSIKSADFAIEEVIRQLSQKGICQ